VERSAASNTLTALGGGFGHVHIQAAARSPFRQLPVCPGISLATLRRQRLIHSMIFCPSPLRRSIKQGLVHAPIFRRCAKRAAGVTDAGKLARALPGQGRRPDQQRA
jgi:hypothetical protein